jgi:hypothetical protein
MDVETKFQSRLVYRRPRIYDRDLPHVNEERVRHTPLHCKLGGGRIRNICLQCFTTTSTMILRHPFSWSSCTLALVAHSLLARADGNDFDCSATIDNTKFDFSSLSGEYTVSRTRDTPPTSMKDELRFDLCNDLSKKDSVPDQDQVSTLTPTT